MREHMGLYRGKRIDNGEWVEGWLVCGSWYINGSPICAIFPDEQAFYPHCELTYYEAVDPDTVGECTGLKDKNGKLIFEGDVVRVHGYDLPHWIDDGEIREVKYRNGAYTPFDEYDSDCGTYVLAGDCEIIGTTTDNPELLKGGEQ